MHLFRALAVTILLVSVTSYADDAKKAPPPAGDSSASAVDVQKFREFWDKLVDIVVANQGDCDKLTVALNAHLDANKDLLDKAHAAATSGKGMPKDLQDHIQSTRGKLMPAFQKCGKHAGFKAAFARLNLGNH